MTHEEFFLKFINFLNEHSVEYWLMCGTLLGAIREKGFLKSDIKDTDIGIDDSDYWKVRKLLENSDFKIYRIWRKEIAIVDSLDKYKIDMFFMEKENNNYYGYSYKPNKFTKTWDVEWRCKYFYDDFFPLKSINLFNSKVFVPRNYCNVLKVHYGKNWHKPNPHWDVFNPPHQDKDYRPIGIVIPSFLRSESLLTEIKSIINNVDPDLYNLYVGNQGSTEINHSKLNCKWFNLPFNCGLSYARNFLIKQTVEPLIMVVDDDFEFTENTNLHIFENILNEKRNLGIVAGQLTDREPYTHNLEYDKINKKLYYIKHSPIWQKSSRNFSYYYCDSVLNCFLAKKEIFNNIRWDNELKLVEHSVTKDTPIIIRDGWKNIKSIPIYKLFPKSIIKPNRTKYLFNSTSKIEIWTDKGWQKIIGIFRHKINEKIYCITTNEGYIQCTKDHSLIINNKLIKPSDLKIGDKIELCKYPKLTNSLEVDLNWAWLLGLFLAEGCYKREQSQCNIANQNIKILYRAKNILQKFGIDSYIVLNMHKKNHCNYLKMKPFKLIDSYFRCFYMEKEKIIPDFIYNFDKKSRITFFEGFCAGDGTKSTIKYRNCNLFSQKSQSIVQGLWYLLSDIYINKSLSSNKNKYGTWFVSNFKKYITKNKNTIKKIEKNKLNDYVYDIETENHHFCGGIGNVNLHNTDYFLRLKSTQWKVAFTPEVTIIHQKQKGKAEYLKYRAKINKKLGFEKFHKKYQINPKEDIIHINRTTPEPANLEIQESKIIDTPISLNKNYSPEQIFEILNENKINYFLIKDSCLQAILQKNLTTIQLGVSNQIEKNNINQLLPNNSFEIQIMHVKKIKITNYNNVSIKVPFPVIRYLEKYTKKPWKEITNE